MWTRLTNPVMPLSRDLQLNLDRLFPIKKEVNTVAGPLGEPVPLEKGPPFRKIPGKAESVAKPKSKAKAKAKKSRPRFGGIWREEGKMGAFLLLEIPLAVASLGIPMDYDLHRKLRGSIFGRDALLASWTSFGSFTGAAIGNITCAALDIDQDTPYCDLIGGVLGGLTAFFIADQVLPHKLSAGSRFEQIHERVTFNPLPVSTQPITPPIGEDHRYPTDSYGP